MAQSGEGKPRVFDVGPAEAAPGHCGAAEALFRSVMVEPMRSEPSSCGVLLGIGGSAFESVSLGEVA
jgi:hypothetical protein